MITQAPTTVVELAKWFDQAETPDTAVCRLFGELVKLAFPHVQHYHSDFYRDAVWLGKYCTQPMTFFYSVGVFGTNIGTEERFVRYAHSDQGVWQIDVVEEDGVWSAHITHLEEPS